MELKGKLLEAVLDCAEGVYLIEEDSRRLVYANAGIAALCGGPVTGKPCYQALLHREAPCPFCPVLCEDAPKAYAWECFDQRHGRWLRVKNRLVTVDGVCYRAGNINAVADMMELSKDAVVEMGLLNRTLEQYDQAKRELEYESTHDRMTRLYNRNQYIRDLACGKGLRSAGVLFFDLNNLKQVNDRYRHAAGDRLLLRLAACLGPAEGKGRRAYRIGGDEFVVLYKNCSEAQLENDLAEILEKLRQSNEGEKLPCVTAVGAAWSDEVKDLERLVSLADRRMYEDKRNKKRENGHA